MQLYLHDVPEEFGGATTFIGAGKNFPCQPKCGSALVFTQNLFHEGSLVKKGIKYTMRTEVMYRLKDKTSTIAPREAVRITQINFVIILTLHFDSVLNCRQHIL